jgi:hypothetical protein
LPRAICAPITTSRCPTWPRTTSQKAWHAGPIEFEPPTRVSDESPNAYESAEIWGTRWDPGAPSGARCASPLPTRWKTTCCGTDSQISSGGTTYLSKLCKRAEVVRVLAAGEAAQIYPSEASSEGRQIRAALQLALALIARRHPSHGARRNHPPARCACLPARRADSLAHWRVRRVSPTSATRHVRSCLVERPPARLRNVCRSSPRRAVSGRTWAGPVPVCPARGVHRDRGVIRHMITCPSSK